MAAAQRFDSKRCWFISQGLLGNIGWESGGLFVALTAQPGSSRMWQSPISGDRAFRGHRLQMWGLDRTWRPDWWDKWKALGTDTAKTMMHLGHSRKIVESRILLNIPKLLVGMIWGISLNVIRFSSWLIWLILNTCGYWSINTTASTPWAATLVE